MKVKRTRLRRPCWEEENEPCASNLISALLFCPCRAWTEVVQGLILVTELASPGATPEPSSACRGLLQGHQPREGTTAHTALGRRGSVRAYGEAKRPAGALAVSVGPGGRCEDRLAPGFIRVYTTPALAHLPGFQTLWEHSLWRHAFPFPSALQRWGAACLQLLADARGKCGWLCPLHPWSGANVCEELTSHLGYRAHQGDRDTAPLVWILGILTSGLGGPLQLWLSFLLSWPPCLPPGRQLC